MTRVLKIHDKYFQPYIDRSKIQEAVHKLALQVHEDMEPEEIPVFIAILNGSFMFAADFIRAYPGMCEISFVKLASYAGTKSTGEVNELVGISEDLNGRTVVILEDIIDTGNTLSKIYDIFKAHQVKTLKIATLFFKPDVFTRALPIDYVGISVPDRFIIGYGLDYNGLGRNLHDIYQLKTKQMKNIVLLCPLKSRSGKADS